MPEFSFHDASVEDIEMLAHIHVASKKAAEKYIVSDEYLESITEAEYAGKWEEWLKSEGLQTLILSIDGKQTGTITFGKLKTPPPGSSHIRPIYSAEIMALYVHPDYWRKGAGQALMQEAAQRMKAQKHGGVCLWALDKNKNACAFYEKLGGQRCGKQMIENGGRTLKEVCYGWRDLGRLIQSA